MSERKSKDLDFVFIASPILSFICVVVSIWILPEQCSLFSDNRMGPFECHTIDSSKPFEPCGCQDIPTAWLANIIVGLGVCFLFLPLIVFVIRNLRDRPVDQTKLFD